MKEPQPSGRNETWADLKQLGYGFLMVAPFVAVCAYGARVLIGTRAALWLGLGIMAVAIVAYGSVAVISLMASYGFDALVGLRRLGRRVRANRALVLPGRAAASTVVPPKRSMESILGPARVEPRSTTPSR